MLAVGLGGNRGLCLEMLETIEPLNPNSVLLHRTGSQPAWSAAHDAHVQHTTYDSELRARPKKGYADETSIVYMVVHKQA